MDPIGELVKMVGGAVLGLALPIGAIYVVLLASQIMRKARSKGQRAG